jgi:hypothetical protein
MMATTGATREKNLTGDMRFPLDINNRLAHTGFADPTINRPTNLPASNKRPALDEQGASTIMPAA